MDRRQKKTRSAILGALSSLLTEKNYDHISVQEIADRADVGRSTFYAHFETKDDLLRELCDELFDHVFSYAPDVDHDHDFTQTKGEPYAVITHILYHLRDNRRNILGILGSESGDRFLRFFRQYLTELYISHMLEGLERRKLSIDPRFLVEHISASFVNLVQWWIRGGLEQSPEELTLYFKALISPVLQEMPEQLPESYCESAGGASEKPD